MGRGGRSCGLRAQTDTIYFDAVDGAKHYAEVLPRRRRKRGYPEADDSERWKLLELEAGLEVRLRKIRRPLRGASERLRSAGASGERVQLVLWG